MVKFYPGAKSAAGRSDAGEKSLVRSATPRFLIVNSTLRSGSGEVRARARAGARVGFCAHVRVCVCVRACVCAADTVFAY